VFVVCDPIYRSSNLPNFGKYNWIVCRIENHRSSRLGIGQRARRMIQAATQIDPLSGPVAYHVAGIYYYSGRYEDAIAQLLKFEYLDPDFLAAHQMLAIVYARLIGRRRQ
jgi:tetratricopeptide (TPR) repeat protein